MLEFQALQSGSNGNATLVRDAYTAILIDAGISAKRIAECLSLSGTDPKDVSAIFVTHEHTDHMAGLKVFSSRYGTPVYATGGTIRSIREKYLEIGGFMPDFHELEPGEETRVGSLLIRSVPTKHDTLRPCAFRVHSGNTAFSVFTDCGNFDEEIVRALSNLDGILLEANHDVRMLEAGPYPLSTKRRILSDEGHLSNELSAELLSRIYSPRLKLVLLGHLSEDNNYPDIARMTVENRLRALGLLDRIRLEVAVRNQPSPLFRLP